MVFRRVRAAPLKLLALFLTLSAVPLSALGWLGYRVLEQDRALEAQQLRDRLDNAGSVVTRELDRGLAAWEELLPVAARGQEIALPPGGVFLLVGPDGVRRLQGEQLPYYPRIAHAEGSTRAVFADAETHEFRESDLTAAIAAYRHLTSSEDEAVRAEALMRLARALRKGQRTEDALAAYARLAGLGAVPVAGAPAELVARRERAVLLAAIGRKDVADRELALLASALTDGRYRIDRPTFEYFSEALPERPPVPPMAAAVEAFWTRWQEQPAGRIAWSRDSDAFVSVWRNTPNGTAAIVAHIDVLTTSLGESLKSFRATARFQDSTGRVLWGEPLSAPQMITRNTREAGLPWSLQIAPADRAALQQAAASRGNLFAAGFVSMLLVVSSASYFVFRAVNRELQVARLQSDFVAAVSHEFRTPLTAMCHLADLLERGDASQGRLADYYRAIATESRRLHAMVENLLDFGRMDSGRRTYEFCDMNAVDLVERVAQEYADRSPTSASRIEKALPACTDDAIVAADREALMLAVRNLLDNAMKYSPADAPVRLSVSRHDGRVDISVQDCGGGISRDERHAIFRKFTRGRAARTLNVKGTGIGLTMVDQIVKAHGGRLQLDSEPGRGSTFTIRLPVAS
jgi:signal transduction histidine kinase